MHRSLRTRRVGGRASGVAALVGLLTLAGCGSTGGPDGGGTAPNGDRLAVVATTTQVADFARTVGGDHVTVTQILKPNVDPHDYEPTPADIAATGAARIVVKNGVGLERWLDPMIGAAGFHGTVVDTSAGVAVRQGEGDEEQAGDPHIWHDPRNAKTMAGNIEQAFEAADPAHAADYARNLAAYAGQLDRLDADSQRKIDSLPAERRKLVTNHDAFGYYVDRYHLRFVGSIIPSFDTSAELSAKQVDELTAKIKATGVTAVFSESSLPPKTAEAIGRQAGVRVVAGDDALYADTLGPRGSAGDTYLRAEEHNTDTIVGALRG
ncbi:metal ABC transporter substrate-binding protein [Micromonospora sp. NPDC049559]|uniref:metal ABC transporter substrate-binding protein n=1 Tax=Micromonospora sp. NPDC049559 TaxID=3155923 RepID=UPI00343F8742